MIKRSLLNTVSAALIVALVTSCDKVNVITSYHIGNSLTWDSTPDGLAALASQRNYAHVAGYHIRCSSSLKEIVSNPTDTCVAAVPKYGHFKEALKSHAWSIVTIQPYPSPVSTLVDDETAVLNIISMAQSNPVNASTRFYIYTGWPVRTNFSKAWTGMVRNNDNTMTINQRQYFEHLIQRVRTRTDALVYLIPVGEVLYELDRRIQAGALKGYADVQDLFRDEVHLTLDVGRFVVGLTTFATLYREDPRGIVKPKNYFGDNEVVFTAVLYDIIYDSIRTVLRTQG